MLKDQIKPGPIYTVNNPSKPDHTLLVIVRADGMGNPQCNPDGSYQCASSLAHDIAVMPDEIIGEYP
jgi:hypothetical protein